MKKLVMIAGLIALGLNLSACGKKGDVNPPPAYQEKPAG
ncbi:LPS translocon maturation chaperone LptM [Kordiimonas marina]